MDRVSLARHMDAYGTRLSTIEKARLRALYLEGKGEVQKWTFGKYMLHVLAFKHVTFNVLASCPFFRGSAPCDHCILHVSCCPSALEKLTGGKPVLTKETSQQNPVLEKVKNAIQFQAPK